MTPIEYFVLLIIAIVCIVGYALARSAANADREWEDEHCEMIETREEFKK